LSVKNKKNWPKDRALWHTVAERRGIRGQATDRDRAKAIGKIRTKPRESRFRNTKGREKSVQKNFVVDRIEGSRKVEKRQKRNVIIV
jgi:hypothetical protein